MNNSFPPLSRHTKIYRLPYTPIPSWHIYFVRDRCQKRGHSANFFVEELNASLDDDAFPLNANIERKQGLHAEHKRQVSL